MQAAAALLFFKMITNGASVMVKPDEVTRAAVDGFTDLTQICVRCPLHHGILDGIVMSLNQLLTEVRICFSFIVTLFRKYIFLVFFLHLCTCTASQKKVTIFFLKVEYLSFFK